MVICSVYDKVACRYGAPIMHVNTHVAVREFMQACKVNPNLPVSDLSLVKIADFDEATGYIASVDHMVLVNGKEFFDGSEESSK